MVYSLLVAAEQFVLPRLKEMSEQSLSQCLDVRNTVDVLLFAETMYADQLKNACFEFICINLPSFLYDRYWHFKIIFLFLREEGNVDYSIV